MNNFCETWYRGLAFWFWILFISGHLLMYIMAGSLIYLQYNHPRDFLVFSSILAFISCALCATCLPMFYIATRYERKEMRTAAIILAICVATFLVAFTSSLILAFFQKPDANSYYRYMMKQIIQYNSGASDEPSYDWFDNVQTELECCGLKGLEDFNIIMKHTHKTTTQPDDCKAGHPKKPCLEPMMNAIERITTTIYVITITINVMALLTGVFYSIVYVAIIEQPAVILTGKIYVRSSVEGILKSFPEIDSEEAVSVSSSD